SGEPRPAGGCRCRNGGGAAGGGECSSPAGATGAAPGPRPGPTRPPCGDTRTAAPSATRPAAARPPPGPWRPGAGRSWRCGGSGPGNEGPFAARYPDGPAPGPCRVVPTGSSFFSDDLLHPVDDQHLLGHQPLEPGVLGLEVLEPPGVGHVQATELVAPAEKVCSVRLCFLHRALIDMAPTSASRRMPMICSSVNRFFMELSLPVKGRELTSQMATRSVSGQCVREF